MVTSFNLKNTLAKILVSSAFLLPTISLAAGNATIEIDGDIAQVHWIDAQNARFNMPGDEGYILAKGKKVYIVSQEDGEQMVMDIGGMAQMAMAFAGEDSIDQLIPESITKVKNTGKKEKIAGIKGEVYLLTVQNSDGEEDEIEVVLTKDKTSNELTDVYLELIENMLGVKNLQETFSQLPKGKRGVLRLDKEFKVTSLSNKTPDSEYLELPSEPLSIQNLMQDLQKALQSME